LFVLLFNHHHTFPDLINGITITITITTMHRHYTSSPYINHATSEEEKVNLFPPTELAQTSGQQSASRTPQTFRKDLLNGEMASLAVMRAYVNNMIEGSQEPPPFIKPAGRKLLPLSGDAAAKFGNRHREEGLY